MSIAYNTSHSRKHLLKEIHMSRVLALKSSILGDYSQSNKLVERLRQKYRTKIS